VHRWTSLVLLLCVLAACADAGTGDADAVADEETIRRLEAELIEADRQFAASVQRRGLAGWITGFSPTGRMIANGRSYVGAEGIRRTMLPLFADTTFSLTWDPNYAEVAASGDMGYTVGRYEQRSQVDGATVVGSGTYLTVWRRRDDGTWKVKADIGNPDAAD
jgi:ketosteroid isomerase-like protein